MNKTHHGTIFSIWRKYQHSNRVLWGGVLGTMCLLCNTELFSPSLCTPTFGLVLQHHVRYLKEFEGKGHLPVGSNGFQQAGQQCGARHLVVTNSGG